jgi:YgiT-type zinc finger domain-containing protein
MTNKITRCISCDSESIRRRKGIFPASVGGATVDIPDIEYYVCGKCGETFLDLDNESKIDLFLAQRREQALA